MRSQANAANDVAVDAARLLSLLRARRLRVHAITNAAAQVFTANLLLAAGAVPSLTHAAAEVESFASSADALLINLGTLDTERREAIPRAMRAARAANRPIVLDPVFVERSPSRLAFARDLLALKPDILRANAAEFSALAKGDASQDARMRFVETQSIALALTGETDVICDAARSVSVSNGDPVMTRVTAMGCAGTALVAAFAALTEDRVAAAASALLVLGVAGEIAAARSQGPGTFQPAFLDALNALDSATLLRLARVS